MRPAIDHYYSFAHYALVLGKRNLGIVWHSKFDNRLRFGRDVGIRQ